MRQARRFGLFGGLAIGAGFAAGAAFAGSGSPRSAASDPGAAVERALEAEGPIVTAAEEAMIAAKCGASRGSRTGTSLRVEDNGVLICGNGRRIDDPEVRALASRLERRAHARVAAVMASPDVKAALSGEIEAHMREQMRDVGPRLEAALREADAARASAVAAFEGANLRVSEARD